MDDNIKLLIEINQNIVKLIESLSKEKDFISLLIENGVFVLIASITSIILTNWHNSSQNKRQQIFENNKLEKSLENELQSKREELFLKKYNSILESFKKYRLEYHTLHNKILTVIKVGEFDKSVFEKYITELKDVYISFGNMHVECINSFKVDLSLLKLNSCKEYINQIEITVIKILDLVRLIDINTNCPEIKSQIELLNKTMYEYLINFMDDFSDQYLTLFKRSNK